MREIAMLTDAECRRWKDGCDVPMGSFGFISTPYIQSSLTQLAGLRDSRDGSISYCSVVSDDVDVFFFGAVSNAMICSAPRPSGPKFALMFLNACNIRLCN